jgi:TetR/AcrR family transcriptional regulator, copper-responsive repressor
MDAARKRRGRPRAYDADLALSRARDTFWRSGYAATSLDDLAGSMAMNRPSIYAGFGDKRALYLAAVRRYAAESREWLATELSCALPLPELMRRIYRGAVDFYRIGGDSPRGCFLVGTAVTEATRDEQIRAVVDETFETFTQLFAARFERAVGEGELATSAPPHALAQIATAALNTIALRVRTGTADDVLDCLIDATISVVCAAA